MLTVVPDHAPTIAFSGPIEVSKRAVMLFKYKADDDYGVLSAEAHVERMAAQPEAPPGRSGKANRQARCPLSSRAPVKSADGKTTRI